MHFTYVIDMLMLDMWDARFGFTRFRADSRNVPSTPVFGSIKSTLLSSICRFHFTQHAKVQSAEDADHSEEDASTQSQTKGTGRLSSAP